MNLSHNENGHIFMNFDEFVHDDEEVSKDESLSISLSKTSEASEELFIPEIMETKKEEVLTVAQTAPEQASAQHQPVIMDNRPKESPQQQQQMRLLNRRKSLDPVRFREIKRELFGSEEFSLKLDDDQPPPPPPPGLF